MMKTNSKTLTGKTLVGAGNLIKLLPTGTVFAFQLLSPPLTNNGNCSPLNKALTATFLGTCGLSCIFSCFTDSYTGSNGVKHHAIVTPKGLWPSPEATDGVDSSKYRLNPRDFIHALFSIAIFCMLVLFDKNSVDCFYPGLVAAHGTILIVLPPVVGVVASTLFVAFPPNRHWIGYPSENDSSFIQLNDSSSIQLNDSSSIQLTDS